MYILVDTPELVMTKSATLTVQQWGNSLAVRIPAAVARSARFRVGQPVEVSAQDCNVLVKSIGDPKLTLAQKLAAFDPALHGGEAMATDPVGKEIV
jgi:antitoxin MazE